MNSFQYKRQQMKELSAILCCKPTELNFVVQNIHRYYNEWFEKKFDKKTGLPKKYKNGQIKQRAIRPSTHRLKLIQQVIKNKILSKVEFPQNVHGGIKTKSNITNAKKHQGKKYQFTTDLQNFYPSVKHYHVYNAFVSIGISTHQAHWLTKLTTWKGELPQGTPTSTHIANLVFLKTDEQLIAFCNGNGITYTRYIDDLTFSSSQDFKLLLPELMRIINSSGFRISHRKTFYRGNQVVTGIPVYNNYIDAPEKIKIEVAKEVALQKSKTPYLNYSRTIRRTNKNLQTRNMEDFKARAEASEKAISEGRVTSLEDVEKESETW